MDPVNSPYEKRVDAKHDVLQIHTHIHQNVSRSHDEIGTLHAPPTKTGATTLIASSGWRIQSQQRGRHLLSQALGNWLFSCIRPIFETSISPDISLGRSKLRNSASFKDSILFARIPSNTGLSIADSSWNVDSSYEIDKRSVSTGLRFAWAVPFAIPIISLRNDC